MKANFTVCRREENGGDVVYYSAEDVEQDYAAQRLHALDLKLAVETAVNALLLPVREVFEADPRLDSPVQNVIPYRNQWALTGYYLGVFSLIPVAGILLALPAIILGVIGLVVGLKQPKRRGKVHAIVAIVLGIVGSYNYVIIIMTVWGGLFGPPPLNNNTPPPPMPGQFPYWG